jgi:eukaryotic translation initiation factor 2C
MSYRGGSRGGGRGRGDFGGRGRGDFRGGRGGGRGGGGRQRAPPRPRKPVPTVRVDMSSGVPPPALEEQYSSLTLSGAPSANLPICRRPDHGQLGRKILVAANHYLCDYRRGAEINHYDVSLDGIDKMELPSSKLRVIIKILNKSKLSGHSCAYDGRSNLYAVPALDFGEGQGSYVVEVPGSKGPQEYTVILKFAARRALTDLDQFFQMNIGSRDESVNAVVSALDVVLRTAASTVFTSVGPNLYASDRAVDIFGGLEVWPGIYQSLRTGECGINLNVDTVASAFVKSEPVIDVIVRALGLNSPAELSRTLDSRQRKMLAAELKGMQIAVTHRNTQRKYRVTGLSAIAAQDQQFQDEEGGSSTVASYFAEKYQALRYPALPCLRAGIKTRPIYLPPEVCYIQGGTRKKTLSDRQTADMITLAARRPYERQMEVHENISRTAAAINQLGAGFGINVKPAQAEVEARVLDPPIIMYKQVGQNPFEQPRNGSWNLIGKQFIQGATLSSWAVINFCRPREFGTDGEVHFVHEFVRAARSHGLTVLQETPPIIKYQGEPFLQTLQTAARAAYEYRQSDVPAPQLIICIKPTTDAGDYRDIKIASDTQIGVPSQCITLRHARDCKPQVLANILLKVNAKLGGVNSVTKNGLVWFSEMPTIIFGADVHHPAPGSMRPSIAAVAATMDRHAAKHMAVTRVQQSRVEMIADLRGMVKELLIAFYQHSGLKPQRILFLRDGVSEGQFKLVMGAELQAIMAACADIEEDYRPTISFVVCQKRHHTRFFASNERDEDRSGNVPAGMVVDRGVTSLYGFDFYLCSHSGIQGTSRPCKYQVLWDENKFQSDTLQLLMYQLTFMYARCTRSVSLPPAVYYSHLMAYRAAYFVGLDEDSETASSISSDQDWAGIFAPVHDFVRSEMFWV